MRLLFYVPSNQLTSCSSVLDKLTASQEIPRILWSHLAQSKGEKRILAKMVMNKILAIL